jgi:hypothetical protein
MVCRPPERHATASPIPTISRRTPITANAASPPQLGATPFTVGPEEHALQLAAPAIVRKRPMTISPIAWLPRVEVLTDTFPPIEENPSHNRFGKLPATVWGVTSRPCEASGRSEHGVNLDIESKAHVDHRAQDPVRPVQPAGERAGGLGHVRCPDVERSLVVRCSGT